MPVDQYGHTAQPLTSLEVYGPDNQRHYIGSGNFTPDADGTFVLLVSPNGTVPSGPLDFSFQVLSPATIDESLTFNTLVTAQIALPGESHRYSFTGAKAQRVVITRLFTSEQGSMQLLDPSGTQVAGDVVVNGLHTLTRAGTYTLVVQGKAAGALPFRVDEVSALPQLSAGLNSGSVQGGALQLWQLAGTRGQKLSIHKTSTLGGDVWFTAYDPANVAAPGPMSNDGIDQSMILTSDGTYVVAMGAYSGAGPGPVTCAFQANTTTEPVTPSGFGVVHSGSITTSTRSQSFTFTGSAGQQVFYDSLAATGSDSLGCRITDSAGKQLGYSSFSAAGDYGPLILPSSGTYTITVSSSWATGDFSFRLVDLWSVPALTAETPASGTLSNSRTDIYTYQGTAGDLIYIDNFTVRATYAPTLKFRDPAVSDHAIATGFYTLPVSGVYYFFAEQSRYDSGSPTYGFQIFDPATTAAVAVGQTVTDSLSGGLTATLYRVSATAGQRLVFHPNSVSDNYSHWWRLYDASGTFLKSDSLREDLVAHVPADGVCLLELSASEYATAPLSYSFTVMEAPVTTAPLVLGAAASGSIAQPGELDQFTFTGAAGQRLLFDDLGSNYQASVWLVDLNGDRTRLTEGGYDSLFTLTESGVYGVACESSSPPVNYSFRLLDTSLAPTVTQGATVSGLFTLANEDQVYLVQGRAGQKLYFDSLPGSAQAFNGTVALYGLDNHPLAQSYSTYALPGNGVYTLVLSPGSGSLPQAYNFRVREPVVTTAPLVLGAVTSGTVAYPKDTAVYTFQGTTGQRLYFNNLGSGTSIGFTLTGPGGRAPYTPQSWTYILEQDGTYQLTVAGYPAATGAYSFQLVDAAAATLLTLGNTYSEQFTTPRQRDFYRFTGTAGQRLRFQASAVSGETSGLGWAYTPWMKNHASSWITTSSHDFDATLPADGSYLLAIGGSSGQASVTFQVTDISDPPVTASGLGTVHQGTIALGAKQTFTFTAPAGLPTSLDDQSASNSGLIFAITDPSGASFYTGFWRSDPLILPRSGTYTVTLHNSYGQNPQSYRFRILDLSAAPVLAFNTPTSGTLDPGFATGVYRFQGNLGQRLCFLNQVGDNNSFEAQLFGPNGSERTFSLSPTSDNVPYRLNMSGTYYLIVSGTQAAAANYGFTVVDADSAPATPLGSTISGHLGGSVNTQAYAIAGQAGQRLCFDSLSASSWNARWALYDPQNNVISDPYLTDDFGATCPAAARTCWSCTRTLRTPWTTVSRSLASAAPPHRFRAHGPGRRHERHLRPRLQPTHQLYRRAGTSDTLRDRSGHG